jgi:hypothetical protein
MVVAEAQEIGMMELPQQEDLVGVVGVVMEQVEVDHHPQLYLALYTLVAVVVDLDPLHRDLVERVVLVSSSFVT